MLLLRAGLWHILVPADFQPHQWPEGGVTWYWSLTWVSWSLILATLISGYTTITSSTTKHQTWIIVINFISVVTIGDCWHCYHKDSNGQTWPGIRHSLLIMGSSKIFVNHRGFVPSGVCLDNSALWEYGRGEVTRLSDDIWDCFMKLFLLQLLHLGPTEMCH